MNKITTFLFLCFAGITLQAQETITGSFMYDGEMRDYRLHLPANVSDDMPMPLVFNLHGYTSDAFQQELYSGMNVVADTAHFAVCYPNGVDNAWNVNFPFGGSSADDVGFISALIDTLAANHPINLARVYSCGMSNGGYMSYKLACELSDRIVAVASVTGSIVPGEDEGCIPTRAVPAMQIHGDADPVVAYEGNFNGLPIEDVVSLWVEHNNCNPEPVITDIPDTNTDDGCTAQRFDYLGGDEDSEVVFYKIAGGEHTWPGAGITIGVTNQDFNASVEIWRFFNRYNFPEDEPNATNNNTIATAIQVVPNPFDAYFSLNNIPTNAVQIRVIDMLGKTIQTVKATGNTSIRISTAAMPAGIYWAIIEGDFSPIAVELLKQ